MAVPSSGDNFRNYAIFQILQRLFPFRFARKCNRNFFSDFATIVLFVSVTKYITSSRQQSKQSTTKDAQKDVQTLLLVFASNKMGTIVAKFEKKVFFKTIYNLVRDKPYFSPLVNLILLRFSTIPERCKVTTFFQGSSRSLPPPLPPLLSLLRDIANAYTSNNSQ